MRGTNSEPKLENRDTRIDALGPIDDSDDGSGLHSVQPESIISGYRSCISLSVERSICSLPPDIYKDFVEGKLSAEFRSPSLPKFTEKETHSDRAAVYIQPGEFVDEKTMPCEMEFPLDEEPRDQHCEDPRFSPCEGSILNNSNGTPCDDTETDELVKRLIKEFPEFLSEF